MFVKGQICVFVDKYDDWWLALWRLHCEKPPPPWSFFLHFFPTTNGKRWCWGEGCLWEGWKKMRQLLCFCLSSQTFEDVLHSRPSSPPSSLGWCASYRLLDHVRGAQSALIMFCLQFFQRPSLQLWRNKVRWIPTSIDVHDYRHWQTGLRSVESTSESLKWSRARLFVWGLGSCRTLLHQVALCSDSFGSSMFFSVEQTYSCCHDYHFISSAILLKTFCWTELWRLRRPLNWTQCEIHESRLRCSCRN